MNLPPMIDALKRRREELGRLIAQLEAYARVSGAPRDRRNMTRSPETRERMAVAQRRWRAERLKKESEL